MELALIAEADADRHLRLGDATRQQLLGQAHASVGDVGVRRQPHLFAERATEAVLVEAGVASQLVEGHLLGEALVEQGSGPPHRRAAQDRTSPRGRAGRLDQGGERVRDQGVQAVGGATPNSLMEREEGRRAGIPLLEADRARCAAQSVERRARPPSTSASSNPITWNRARPLRACSRYTSPGTFTPMEPGRAE